METEKMLDMSQALKQKKQFAQIRETVEQERQKILGGMADDFNIDEALDKYTSEEIDAMTFEQMKEAFVTADGKFIFNESEYPQQMMMDFIKYLKESKVTFEKMDAEMEKLDTYLAEFSDEVKTLTAEHGSFNKTLRATIEADLAKPDCTPDLKTKCEKLLGAMDDAVTLRPLFELYEKISPANTLKELNLEGKRIEVLKGYARVCKENGMEPKLLGFGELEKAFLDEKYHEHKNLFVFIVARYIKYLGRNLNSVENRTFIVQLTNYLREMILGEGNAHYDADKTEIEALKVNMASLLDRFYN